MPDAGGVGFQLRLQRRRGLDRRRCAEGTFARIGKTGLDRRQIVSLIGETEAQHHGPSRQRLGKDLVIVR